MVKEKQKNIYMGVWLAIQPHLQKLDWQYFLHNVIHPVFGQAMFAITLALLCSLHDHTGHIFMEQVIDRENVKPFQGVVYTPDILPTIERFLDLTYSGQGLSWYRVLEVPALRQIRADYDCYDSNLPKGLCNAAGSLTPDAVSKSCSRCLSHEQSVGHVCMERNSDGKVVKKISEYPECHNKRCEVGFGYCPELGDAAAPLRHSLPKGGHGLYLTLDEERTYSLQLSSLRDQNWLDYQSQYVSLVFTAVVSPTNFVRVRLHFTRLILYQWEMTHDFEMGQFFHQIPLHYDLSDSSISC